MELVKADPGLERLSAALAVALRAAGAPEGFAPALERPRDPAHGDWASNAALVLARRLGEPPRPLAERIRGFLDAGAAGVLSVDVAGPGFLNFRLSGDAIWPRLEAVLEADEAWGRSRAEPRLRVNVEFVSANPTGPLHVAHGRGAALGDAVASLMEWAGHDVTRECYVNDAGRQIELLAESVEARYAELRGRTGTVPEGGYHGEYVSEVAAAIRDKHGAEMLDGLPAAERTSLFRAEAVRLLEEEQSRDLFDFGVEMDVFSSEQSVQDSGDVAELLEALAERGLTYEKEGATWLRTSDFGDEQDRVLIKSDGAHTYFLPDIAYHLGKARRGFDLAIDVWGADHQGHERRMLAALKGLSHPDLLEVLIIQLVTVTRSGVAVPMSKRTGRFVTLADLVKETGRDVARYFFLMRRAEVHLSFDLALALDTSEANPVYKVQYAHARMCSVLRRAAAGSPSVPPGGLPGLTSGGPQLPAGAVGEAERSGEGGPPAPDHGHVAVDDATKAEREVALAVLRLPEVFAAAASARAPHIVCAYLEETAGLVNAWYHQGNLSPELRILADGPARERRLRLARAVRITLRNGLRALGLGAPEEMVRSTPDTTNATAAAES